MRTITWDSLHIGKSTFHLARVNQAADGLPQCHDHDFAELTWIESGVGMHLINDERQELRAGQVVMMRAADRHTYYVRKDAPFVFINIAFRLETLDHLRARYFPESTGFFWATTALPQTYTLSPEQHQQMGVMVRELAQSAHTVFSIERFLLNVLFTLTAPLPAQDLPHAPSWVRDACLHLTDEEIILGGVPALVQATGRSAEHVARAIKHWTGKTPTELVNNARLELATGHLCLTDDDILAIAMSCGFNNLSHFYALFRKQYGVTPRQYRQRHKRVY